MINEKTINERVGKNIRKYRLLYSATKHNLTQSDLAEKVGVSVSLIGCLESPKVKQGISLYNLYKISEYLNVPIDKFFE
jgi:transcriptional regulator with XRE-family HTH domain